MHYHFTGTLKMPTMKVTNDKIIKCHHKQEQAVTTTHCQCVDVQVIHLCLHKKQKNNWECTVKNCGKIFPFFFHRDVGSQLFSFLLVNIYKSDPLNVHYQVKKCYYYYSGGNASSSCVILVFPIN